jgi:hypothetical protein
VFGFNGGKGKEFSVVAKGVPAVDSSIMIISLAGGKLRLLRPSQKIVGNRYVKDLQRLYVRAYIS